MQPFIVADEEHAGDNWMLCFGRSLIDNKSYYITTNHMHMSEATDYLADAKVDAELVCRLLNEYYQQDKATEGR